MFSSQKMYIGKFGKIIVIDYARQYQDTTNCVCVYVCRCYCVWDLCGSLNENMNCVCKTKSE